MDDPNITMKEYIRIEEEKSRRRGKVYNWETAKYGKIWCDEDVHDLRSVETEFPAIVFNDKLSSEKTLSCEPTVSSLNDNEIDFRISFDESDDEDYTDLLNENNEFGGVHIFWNLMCVVVMRASRSAFTTHNLARKRNLENLPSKISGEFLILIFLILVFNVLSIQRGRCIIQVGDGN
ncbi:hypothetical protein Tco_0448633 [Tanacetum coccineum]